MDEKQVKKLAVNKLSRKRYFSQELKKLLLQRGAKEQVVDPLIATFQKEGYLDDADGIESVIRQAIRQSKGPVWIKQMLQKKGVSINFQEIEKIYPASLRTEKIQAFLEKGRFQGKKAIAALVRRGFSLEEILSVYKKDYYESF